MTDHDLVHTPTSLIYLSIYSSFEIPHRLRTANNKLIKFQLFCCSFLQTSNSLVLCVLLKSVPRGVCVKCQDGKKLQFIELTAKIYTAKMVSQESHLYSDCIHGKRNNKKRNKMGNGKEEKILIERFSI